MEGEGPVREGEICRILILLFRNEFRKWMRSGCVWKEQFTLGPCGVPGFYRDVVLKL